MRRPEQIVLVRRGLVSPAGTLNTVLYTIDPAFARPPCEPYSASSWPRRVCFSHRNRHPRQDKPRLLAIDGFMLKGASAELDPEQMKRRLSPADIERLHFDGSPTAIEEILRLMAGAEKLRTRVDEPLEVRGEIPITLPPNTTGSEAYTTCFYAFTANGLAVAAVGESLVLIRPERPGAPRLERKWNREQVLPIRLFRLGYLKSDPILAQYKDKLGTKAGRAILEAKSNVVIVADGCLRWKSSSVTSTRRFFRRWACPPRRATRPRRACDHQAWGRSRAAPTSTSTCWRLAGSVKSP